MTFINNAGFEQTSENLVVKILDQLKTWFLTSECLGSQYYQSLLNISY